MTPEQIQYHINVLITYIQSKIELKDWHAVSDAANDIRELEMLRDRVSKEAP